jgi:uncharacterized protein YbjT (DUF2867 family)
MSIVVTTPTGNIGHVVVEELLQAGEKVTVVVRDPARLSSEVRDRVSVVVGDQFEPGVLASATEGATALFYLTPPNFTVPDWKQLFVHSAATVADAVTTNKIPYVVHLSSAGADRPTGLGPVSHLHLVENAIAETGTEVLHLRPVYFYENILSQLDAIRNMGSICYPFFPDVKQNQIATRDIGVVAARKLRARDWSGSQILGLHGPEDAPTFSEIATIIGEVIGKPVQFVQIPAEAFHAQLLQFGASQSVADNYVELMTAVGNEGLVPAEPRTPETTTPTTFREWVTAVLKPALS